MGQAKTYTEQLVRSCAGVEQQQFKIKNLLDQLDSKPAGLQTSLEWESDNAMQSFPVVILSTGVAVTSPWPGGQ